MAPRFAATVALLAFAGLLCGCPEDEPEEAPGDERGSEAAPPPQPLPAPPSTGLEEGRVRDLVDGWLAAQNAGDFEAYGAAYARRFEGVKRSGERTYRFDRESWLADRRRMFLRPMQVESDDLSIVSTAGTAVVSFRQTWSSATYRDVGPKQLVVVHEGDELRIAREEMLRSLVVGRGALGAPPLEALALVTRIAGAPHLVLHSAPAEAWSAGPIRRADQGETASALRRAMIGELPEELRGWSRRAVRLYGPEGAVCTGTVGELRVVHRVVPHFSTRQGWRGEEGGEPQSAVAIAQQTWELGAGEGALLVGVVIPDGGGACEGALWGRDATRSAPAIFSPGPAPASVATDRLRRFRALPGWQTIQRDFLAYPDTPRGEGWDGHDGASPVLRRWAGDGRSFATVRASAGSACAEFGGALWALYEDVDGEPALRTDGRDPGAFEPLAIVDADGDGLVEIVVPDGLLRASPEGLSLVLSIAPPYFDCDC